MEINKKEIDKILSELYLLDPALKSQESELITIINNIIKLQPEIKIGQDFINRLRQEIMTEAVTVDKPKQSFNFFNFNHMNKFVYLFYGATATVLLVVASFALIYGNNHKSVSNLALNKKVANVQKFSKLTEVAFGPLNGLAGAANISPMGAGGAIAERGASVNGLAKASSVAAPTAMSASISNDSVAVGGKNISDTGAISGRADSKMMPPYEGKTIKYVYKGKDLELKDTKLDVVKRVKGVENGVDAKNLISGFNVDFVDLNSFANQRIQNINFIQKGDFGYITTVSLDEGMVSIYQNWETWPSGKCGSDNKCFESLRVTEGDIPSNEELIAIADEFVTAHAINKSNYGEPEVNSDWRGLYAATTNKADYYFPDSIEVIYPLKIDGKFVQEEYNGVKSGLSVYVQVKDKKVSSVNNLTTQIYNTSAYEMETDAKKIIAYAEKGGLGGAVYWGADNKIDNVELSDPEMVYVRQYIYKDNQSTELYVPALSFPINNMPKDANFYRKSVIVPLAKEILDERLKEGEGGAGSPGVPMPMDAMIK